MFYRCSTARAAATATTISSKLFYLLVLYNYLIYNYYYTHRHTHIQTHRERERGSEMQLCTVGSQWLVLPHCIHFRVISNGARNPTLFGSGSLMRLPLPLSLYFLISLYLLLSLSVFSLYLPPSLSLTLYLPNNCMRFDGSK